ncbi:MAG: SurA N-terminal domain-containing protein [Dokdonella sp.]
MLSKLRNTFSGWFGKIIFGLILFAFSFFGIESYMVTRVDSGVAHIGDREITQQQFRQRFDEYRQQMLRQMGDQANASYFERPEIKRQFLDSLIDEQVVLAFNDKYGVRIPAKRMQDEISSIPVFQTDGHFDSAQYRALLAARGMSVASFEERVRQDLASRELPMQINSTSFVTEARIDNYLRLRDQLRDARVLKLDKPVPTDATIADTDIEKYYEAHKSEFMRPEQVAVDYVELDAPKLDVNLTPDDATLKERYEKEKSRFVASEQRLTSHILIKVSGKGGPEDQKSALAKAQALVSEARGGKDFAGLAKQSSDDLGSKAQGGDLGWLEKGLTDPAFDDALFAMKKGDISDPVLSSEGYHIIDLRDLRPGSTRSFEEVKPELTREYADSERERVYNETAGRLIDLTYQDPSSLESAAKELHLKVQKSELFGREDGTGIAANPKVAQAAFSDSVLVQGNNSDPVELGPNHVVVLRIATRKPTEVKPLAEVRTAIHDRMLAERVAAQAKSHADALFARLEKGETLEALAAEVKGKVDDQKGIGRQAATLDGALVQAIFAMPKPTAGKPDDKLVPLADDSYALVQLDKVADSDPAKLDATARESARTQLTQGQGNTAALEFVAALRKATEIKINEANM